MKYLKIAVILCSAILFSGCLSLPFLKSSKNDAELSVQELILAGRYDEAKSMVKTAGAKTDLNGDTILHYAARSADIATVKHLLELGLDRTRRNNANETAYDIAKRWKRMDIAALLI